LKKYIINFNWLFLEKIIKIFGGLFIGIWVARYLGPHDFGVLSYALAFIAFFSWASHLGLNQIVVRELTKYPEKRDNILGSAFFMKLVGAIVSVMLISVTISFIKPEDELIRLVVFIVSLCYIFQVFDVLEFYYQAKVQSKYTSIAKNIAFLISSILQVYFILSEKSIIYFAIVNVVNMFFSGVFLVYLYKKLGFNIKSWRYDNAMAKELIKYSWPLMISSFLINIHLKIDQLMIEHYLGMENVGLYSVAVKLAESWYFVPLIIVSTLMPYFVKLRENNNKLYHYRLVQLYFGMFWLGVSVALLTQLIGEDAIVLLFGEEYRNSFAALALNIWAGIFVAQSAAKGIWDISENLQLYRIVSNSVAIVINVLGNIIMIPLYGIMGAAIATLITRVFNNWITPMFIKAYRQNTIESIKAINPLYVYSQRRKVNDQ